MKVRCIDVSLTWNAIIRWIECGCIYEVEDQYNVEYSKGNVVTIYVVNWVPFNSNRFTPLED